ncbi:hypothetical protein PV08_05003 [Exophiala spinifera]|uniref:Mitochondrial outer membrane transport complex Sam37/metaxin N-terminal domain-containing protein n=1 Tax=Exophiala spinifera TaxID=91928 RepID=A0A0D2BFM4_9EURO|nr:uncharacterized protein PV08_05003 [Exophiala spinifera]KIW17808.1 hypothetical protein PV08_05003 [Exophiala spinifera]
MVLELHVWGPAFDLPSIDGQCLATIYYLRKALGVPGKEWVLVRSGEPRVSPFRELPALKDEETWVAGFGNIVSYLRDVSDGQWDLDRRLSDTQRADCAAFSSFVESRGQPLLDLSLYVSSDNYFSTTRPALAQILPWPNSWVLPHHLRERAKKRTEHLGLSSLDLDNAQEDQKDDVGLSAHIPKSLRKPKQTVTSLLGRSMQKNKFRLDAITAEFLEPIASMLGGGKFLLACQESSLDCLVLGYLALMQRPQMPHAWIRDSLRSRYASLGRWAEDLTLQVFAESTVKITLVSQSHTDRSIIQVLQSAVEVCIGSMPVIGAGYTVSEISPGDEQGLARYKRKQARLARLQRRRDLYLQTLASAIAATGLVGWLWYKGVRLLPSRAAKGRTFGQAGSLFGLN